MARRFILLTLCVWREEDYWAGECIELGTATDGDDPDEVRDELSSLTATLVDVLAEDGELERVLQERGVKIYTDELPKRVTPPELPVREQGQFSWQEKPLFAAAG